MTWRRLAGLLTVFALVAGGSIPLPARAQPVSTLAVAAALPDPGVLSSRLGAVSTKKLTATASAVLGPDGTPLLVRDRAMVPASTMKLFTALAAVDVLGADRRFTTKVVSARKGRLTLVAGGDPFLTVHKSKSSAKPANLDALARATARSLKAQQVKRVTLTYDARLFSGASYSASWKKSWASYTPRIMALTVSGGKSGGRAYTNPAASTTRLFASLLRAKGFTVNYGGAAKAAKGATLVASVSSAPVGSIVRRMLRVSDNVAAEMLARHVARAVGRPGSFSGGSAAITDWLKGHRLWKKGMKIDGGSGLSSLTKVYPSVLARAVGFALADPAFVDVVKGLPTAGVNGTLEHRFDDAVEKAGRVVVHAKTGTLRKVSALAGYVTTADGAVLTFAFLATHNGTHSAAAANWLDRSAAVLAGCGCQLARPAS